MSKLFAFGCSYTYGHGLSDCIIGEHEAGPEPSKLVYVNLLAEYLNIDQVVNQAQPGKSNKWILSALEAHLNEIAPNDVVILQWSFIERHAILGNESKKNYIKSIDLGPWKKDKINTTYYKTLYHEHDHVKQTIWCINYADFLLKHRGIKKVLHTAPPGGLDISEHIINKQSYWNDCLADNGIDKADDNNHPGIKTHKLFAKKMYDSCKYKLTIQK